MCVCTHMFAGVPVAETGKRCYNTAGTEGSAAALGRVFGSLVCKATSKGSVWVVLLLEACLL